MRFFQLPYCYFLWNNVLKEFLILRLGVSAVLKFQNKTIVHYTYNFVAELFYDNIFYSLFFDCSTLFFVNEFFWKIQNLSESMFLHNIIFINSLVFIGGKFLYKVRTKLHYREKQPPEVLLKILQISQENTCARGLQLY